MHSLCVQETVKIGPDSVEYRIKQEALCFGGKRCTTTDVAIASGVAPSSICSMPEAVFALSSRMVYAAMREIKKMLEAVIDTMKVGLIKLAKILTHNKVTEYFTESILITSSHIS